MKRGFNTLSPSTACLSLTTVNFATVQAHSCTERLQSSHHFHVDSSLDPSLAVGDRCGDGPGW